MSVKEMDAIQILSSESDEMQVLESNESIPTKFRNHSHAVQLAEGLQSLRNDDVLCDIKLKTDDGTIVVGHKNVLITVSPYFRAMFGSFDESKKNIVNIRELDSTTLKLLVDYIYTGEILVTGKNVQVLFSAANILQLDYVSTKCQDFMKTLLDPSNCLGIKAFANLHNCMELLSSSEAYIKKHFLKVTVCDEFLSLSCEEVIKLISCEDLTVPFEEKVFECVINWVKHELDCRKDFLPKLMEHIRLPLISEQYLIKNVSEEPLILNSLQCNGYVIEALRFHILQNKQLEKNTIPQTIRNTPRRCGSSQKAILLFSRSTKLPKCYIEWYDPVTKLQKTAPKMNNCRRTAGLGIVRDTFIFALGGVNRSSSKSVSMLDLSLQSQPYWVPMVEMLVSRRLLGVGVLDDCVYAVGGCNGTTILKSVEVFDFKKWKMVSDMSTHRKNVGVAVFNNRLYAIGGYDGSNTLKSVECYNPMLNIWTPVVEMSVVRQGVGVGVIGDVIYAIGGYHKGSYLRSAEAFRPSDGVWSPIADMHLRRFSPGVVTVDGLLYVIGGYNGIHKGTKWNSLEIYNPNTNSWSMESLSRNAIKIFAGVLVNRPPFFITS